MLILWGFGYLFLVLCLHRFAFRIVCLTFITDLLTCSTTTVLKKYPKKNKHKKMETQNKVNK